MEKASNAPEIDTALECLVMIAQGLEVPIDKGQAKRVYVVEKNKMDTTLLLRAAKGFGLKAGHKKMTVEQLQNIRVPLIGILKNGDYVVLAKTTNDSIFMVFDPRQPRGIPVKIEHFVQHWSGEAVFIARRFKLADAGKIFDFTWFIPAILRFKRPFIEVIIASFILQLFSLVTPLFTQVIIDKVLIHKGVSTLDILALGLFIIAIFDTVLGSLRTYLFSHTTNKIDVILSSRLFHHITALPLQYFEMRRVGDTVARVRELENIRQFITGSTLTLLLDIFFAFVFIVVMVIYSPLLSIVALLALPAYIILSLMVTPIYREQLSEQFNAGAENHSYLVETITGIQSVKSLAIEPQLISRWEKYLARYVKVSFDTANTANIAGNVSRLIQSVSTLSILWLGAHLVMDNKLTVGQLVAFQMLAGQVSAPVLRLVGLWQQFQQTRISIERLGDILNTPAETIFNPNRTNLPAITGDIRFEQVSFRYRMDGPEILSKIDLRIKPGTRIGIVGRSGSGKSTLTKLLQRLYFPSSGRIMVDNIDLSQVDPTWLRRQIGVVLQESFLFNGTIRENIAITNPAIAVEEVYKVAKITGVHEFVLELPEGYDTQVGERGLALSGGQKQRIAIARALLNNPRLLIFDEATSALDYQSEYLIMENMDQICAGRTVIIIAHRISTVQQCETIAVMDHGRIVEQGTHRELMSIKRVYYQLYTKQEGSYEV